MRKGLACGFILGLFPVSYKDEGKNRKKHKDSKRNNCNAILDMVLSRSGMALFYITLFILADYFTYRQFCRSEMAL